MKLVSDQDITKKTIRKAVKRTFKKEKHELEEETKREMSPKPWRLKSKKPIQKLRFEIHVESSDEESDDEKSGTKTPKTSPVPKQRSLDPIQENAPSGYCSDTSLHQKLEVPRDIFGRPVRRY